MGKPIEKCNRKGPTLGAKICNVDGANMINSMLDEKNVNLMNYIYI